MDSDIALGRNSVLEITMTLRTEQVTQINMIPMALPLDTNMVSGGWLDPGYLLDLQL